MASQCQKENQPQCKSNSEPWFPQATEILFCTGNTLARFKLLPEANSTVTEQVTEYISMLLQMVETDADKKQFRAERYVKVLPAQNDTAFTAANGSLDSPIDNEQLSREHIKYSVKIFLRVLEPDVLTHTIDTVLNELKETYLESVMIAVPNYARDLTVEKFMPLWRVIEDFIDKKKILSAAVCDFMLPLLSDFYDAAKHKPYGNQINLTTCCAIPDELGKYAKEKNIQLLTHGDPDDVMGDSTFQKTIRAHCHESDALNWTPCSLVRYTSVIALRGIIKSKGFFIYARRDLHAH